MKTCWHLVLMLLLAVPAHAQDEAVTEEAPAEEASVEEPAADESAEPSEPLALYAGIDYVQGTVSLSSAEASDFDTGMYRARIGRRWLEAVGLELHAGMDASDDAPGNVETESYFGAFIVPTATVWETVELAFPVGYALSSVGSRGASEELHSVAYGIDAELPFKAFGEGAPDLRLTAGWMVYYQKSDARVYGANVGLRYDFSLGGGS